MQQAKEDDVLCSAEAPEEVQQREAAEWRRLLPARQEEGEYHSTHYVCSKEKGKIPLAGRSISAGKNSSH